MTYCTNCGDLFDPVEYNASAFDDVNFCSWDCSEAYENWSAYSDARHGGAPAV